MVLLDSLVLSRTPFDSPTFDSIVDDKTPPETKTNRRPSFSQGKTYFTNGRDAPSSLITPPPTPYPYPAANAQTSTILVEAKSTGACAAAAAACVKIYKNKFMRRRRTCAILLLLLLMRVCGGRCVEFPVRF